jgi:MFS family permease
MLAPLHRQFALFVLTLVYTLNFLDRGLIILLLQPIKDDLRLTDTQLGFLTGIAFGLFYATVGIPIARRADRSNRVTITSVAIGLWGLTVMLCVLVTNFAQLLLARIAAAVGEAGCGPPTYSLLGDYFPGRAERGRAMAIYWLANPLSALIGFMVGGWLNARLGWRLTFLVAGVPGLLAAILVRYALVEPRVAGPNRPPAAEVAAPKMSEVLLWMWSQRSSRHLCIAIVLFLMMGFGLGPWYGAFMMRSHAIGTSELGVWLGLIFGVGGIVGAALGALVGGHALFANERAQMRLTGTSMILLVPCSALFLLTPGKYQALLALCPIAVAFNFFFGPSFALMQRLVSDRMRATVLAVVMLLANIIGMGIGPQAVGLLSDLLHARLGTDSLRYSMLIVSLVAAWSGFHFWKVSQTVNADLRAMNTLEIGRGNGPQSPTASTTAYSP